MKLLLLAFCFFTIAVGNPAFANDKDIKSFVLNEFKTVGVTSVKVTVKRGAVVLKGNVRLPNEKVFSSIVPWHHPKVREVVNDLRVEDTSSVVDLQADLKISAILRGKLIVDRNVSSLSYSINVVNGVVYLSGRAENRKEMESALANARKVPNAKSVENYVLLRDQKIASVPAPPKIATPPKNNILPKVAESPPSAKPQIPAPPKKPPVVRQQPEIAKPLVPKEAPKSDNNKIFSASSGSGFAVSNDGYIVTNHHVVDGCQNVFIHLRGKKYSADLVTYDKRNDLALLKGDFVPELVLPITANKPYLAQDIFVSGYPFGLNISSSVKVTKGIISSLTGIDNNLAEMQIDAALQSGNSGGPILDEYGNVVGVAVAKLDVKFALENFGAIPENTNFGVKANIVEALLDANGVNYQQGKAEKPSGAEFSNMLSNGTYYISCWMTLAQIEAMKTKKVMFSDLQ